MFTEETDKIEFSSNDDKRLQTFVKVSSYPYHANVRKVCKRIVTVSKYKHKMKQNGHIFQIIHTEY